MSEPQPYLSIVVAARNDDHGGNFLRRMQTFVNALAGQCRRFGLDAELIVVEWNPPADREPLARALRWPEEMRPCRVRVIEAPEEIHRRYRHAEALPLYQMIAKNVGIRRARGRFVLATNIDIVFSDELARFLAEQRLEKGRMYRMDRHDVMAEVPVDASVEEQLAWCRSHLIRVNAREGTFNLTRDGLRTLAEVDVAAQDSGIHFGTGWYPAQRWSPGESLFRWANQDAEVILDEPRDAGQVLFLDVEPGPGVGYRRFLLQVLNGAGELLSETEVPYRTVVAVRLPLAEGARRVLRFRTVGGGMPLFLDPHVLNFRVFHCGWSRPADVFPTASRAFGGEAFTDRAFTGKAFTGKAVTGKAVTGKAVTGEAVTGEALGGRHGVNLAFGDEAIAAPAGRSGADAGARASHARRGLEARRKSRGWLASRQDIVDATDGLLAGDGWYPAEKHGRRAFRWGRDGAELIVFTPAGPPRALVMRAQAGPAVGFERCTLQVHDCRGEVVATATLEKKPREIRLALPWRPGQVQVFALHVEGGGAAVPALDDPRILQFRLFPGRWEASGRAGGGPVAWDFESNPAFDIARPDAGFYWGSGWGPPERAANGETFRWGRDGAEIVVRAPEKLPGALWLEIEPGPGTGFGAFHLRLLDANGEEAARVLVQGHKSLHLRLRLRSGRAHVFTLRAEPVDPAAAGDAELPAFRLFHCGWPKPPADIARPAGRSGGLVLGAGWRPPEAAANETFRWAANDAEIVVQNPEARVGSLDLEIEAGPGLARRPFVLQVLNDSDEAVYEATVLERRRLHISLPIGPGRPCLYRLHAAGEASQPAAPDDTRAPSFRVFCCAWTPQLPGRFSARADNPSDGSDGRPPLPAAVHPRFEDEEIVCCVDLHTNACGDFTLMAREHWLELRGYPEFDAFSFNLDSVLCFAAHHGGAPEEMLGEPLRIYHIEHATGSGWTPEGRARLFERIRAKGIPCVEDGEVFGWALQMRRLNAPMIFNGEGWGLAGLELLETDPAKTEAEARK